MISLIHRLIPNINVLIVNYNTFVLNEVFIISLKISAIVSLKTFFIHKDNSIINQYVFVREKNDIFH